MKIYRLTVVEIHDGKGQEMFWIEGTLPSNFAALDKHTVENGWGIPVFRQVQRELKDRES